MWLYDYALDTYYPQFGFEPRTDLELPPFAEPEGLAFVMAGASHAGTALSHVPFPLKWPHPLQTHDDATIYPDDLTPSPDEELMDGGTASATDDPGPLIIVIATAVAYSGYAGGGGVGREPMDSDASIEPNREPTVPDNVDFPVANDDAPCENGAAIKAAQAIKDLKSKEGNYEFVGLLVRNSDGSYGLADNEISTHYSTDYAGFDNRPNYASTYGIIHNHALNDTNYNQNFLQRYPSDGDWAALDMLVARGANPANLSMFVVDPFGVVREFPYADKGLYQAMTDQQRYKDVNLPASTKGCA